MFTMLMIILMLSIIIVLFLPMSVKVNNSIMKTIVNTRNGIIRECEAPFLVPRTSLFSFSQLQMKFVGMKQIVSKNLKITMIRLKLQFRNNLNEVRYKLYLLGNGIKKRAGPFLGERFGVMEAGTI